MGRKNTLNDVWNSIDTHDNDPDVCWEWVGSTGGRDHRGYMSIDGKKLLAHRIVYTLAYGDIPPDTVIRHKCDNPICCNPMHLEPGTRGDNELDKYERNRAGYTDNMLREMRRLGKLGMSYRSIADELNKQFDTRISHQGVGRVLRGETRRPRNV